MGVSSIQGANGSILDTGGGIKVRLPYLQMDNMDACSFHTVGLFQDIHNNEGFDFLRTLRDHITLFNGYSIIPSAPLSSSLGIRSRTTEDATTVSTANQSD